MLLNATEIKQVIRKRGHGFGGIQAAANLTRAISMEMFDSCEEERIGGEEAETVLQATALGDCCA